MLINEKTIETDNGKKYLRINFDVHRATIYHEDIEIEHVRCAALKMARAKEKVIENFLNTIQGQHYTKKEVLKAYSKIDPYFKDVYKEQFPHGGSRSGVGRKKGSKTSNRTERFTQAITPEEKAFLTQKLEEFRRDDGRVWDELAPYLRAIEEKFGKDTESRDRWRRDMERMNPALLYYCLQEFKTFGIDHVVPKYLKGAKRPGGLFDNK